MRKLLPTVLFVEDSDLLRQVVSEELSEAGFRVLEAASGEDALAVLRERVGQIDWLFTDIRLPGPIDGWRVADEFRFTYPLRPVIFASGDTASRPRAYGDSLFLRKPYRVSEVVESVRSLQAGWTHAEIEIAALRRLHPSVGGLHGRRPD
ncbi:response regulator [Salinarimonas soli]|uniref:response regulator n=1 Tax=Salinarimonas soli TaxID=1638099 RepID=UPI001AEEEA10|nr:response regulator [Salinarimonas soli]